MPDSTKTNISIVFVSNFFNHHQKSLCDSFVEKVGAENFRFVETEKIPDERIKLGYLKYNEKYLISYIPTENDDEIINLISSADIVIKGSAPNFLFKQRLMKGKIIFKYSERLLKKGNNPIYYISRYFKYKSESKKNVYLLCASAYCYSDYLKFHAFKKKAYNWGYFPEYIRYDDINKILEKKEHNSILWCGRLIDWKHPELAIECIKKLIDAGIDCQLTIVGTGPLEDELKKQVLTLSLKQNITFLGALSPDEVRTKMEQSQVLLITSDFNEGWGAVLNEGMNSCCCCVCSHAAGSAPLMIKDGINGYIFKSNDIDSLYNKVHCVLVDENAKKHVSKEAYYTINNEWNPEIASTRLLHLFNSIINNKDNSFLTGPCSNAVSLKNNWYK